MMVGENMCQSTQAARVRRTAARRSSRVMPRVLCARARDGRPAARLVSIFFNKMVVVGYVRH